MPVQVHADLPITLILGMATSAGALQQMLPVAAAGMLEAQHFQLASSMERYTPPAVVVWTAMVSETAQAKLGGTKHVPESFALLGKDW